MALFPKCSFQVLVSDGLVVPGKRLDGQLVVIAPEPIPRAERIDLAFRSNAWAGYGSGKNRRVVRRSMWLAPFRVAIQADPLPAGEHRFPFSVDVPHWLPPGYRGADCGLDHTIEVRLDVDWAVDPTMTMVPLVAVLPREGVRTPYNTRSRPAFHESLVVDVTLASAVIAQDEPLQGHIALRSGHGATFDAIELAFMGTAAIVMGQGDARPGASSSIRIPAEALRGGEAVAFQFPANQHVMPGFSSGFIDHRVMLRVTADIPWAFDPSFDVPLDVLPRGSVIHGEASEGVVGVERLRLLATAMAEATGLRVGRAPTLVEGNVGPVGVRIVDAPRGSWLGIDVELTFPDVELGIELREIGMLDGFRTSPLLPAALQHKYVLRCSPIDERPPVHQDAVAELVSVVLSELTNAAELRFSDHHLTAHFVLDNDGGERMVGVARASLAKAKSILHAIGRLPFPSPVVATQPAWAATAAEQGAVLVPTGPTLHGLVMRARVLTGEERAAGFSIRTVWTKAGPATHVDLDLHGAPVPKTAWSELESKMPGERLRAVRAVFPTTHVTSQGTGATLERPEATADPRALLSAIESFFGWVLDVRGERRVDSPYR